MNKRMEKEKKYLFITRSMDYCPQGHIEFHELLDECARTHTHTTNEKLPGREPIRIGFRKIRSRGELNFRMLLLIEKNIENVLFGLFDFLPNFSEKIRFELLQITRRALRFIGRLTGDTRRSRRPSS